MATFSAVPRRNYSFRPRTRQSWRRYRGLIVIIFLFLICSWWFGWFTRTQPYAQAATRKIANPRHKTPSEPRIGKVSMLYGRRNELYERALDSHHRHNLIHGYSMDVLRQDLTKGYWNKLAWLQSIVVQELAKPEQDRLDWLMWVEVENIILNPQIPLKAFLPPQDLQLEHVHFLGSRRNGQLLSGAFFVRVHPWTLTFLTRAMSLPMMDQEIEQQLGIDKDINALAFVLNETAFSNNVFYQPRAWYNALHTASALEAGLDDEPGLANGAGAPKPRAKSGFEGDDGTLLVQFPATSNGAKWKHMGEWLNTLRYRPNAFEMRFDKTFYPDAIKRYWSVISFAREALYYGDVALDNTRNQDPKSPSQKELAGAVIHLSNVLTFEPYDAEKLQKAIDRCDHAVKTALSSG